MKKRLIAGIPAAAIAVCLILYAPASVLLSVVILLSGLSYIEFDRLFFERKNLLRELAIIVLITFTIISLTVDLSLFAVCLISSFIVISACHVWVAGKSNNFDEAVRHTAFEVMGYLYIICLLGFLIPLLEISPKGREYVLFLLVLVFAGDTGGYFFGMLFGKHRLASAISPKKTIEGAIGSTIASLLVGLTWAYFFNEEKRSIYFLVQIGLLSFVLSVAAQVGDLFESVLKRSRSQKDSGQFLPGHGGLLDRIDGLCFSAPLFYFYVKFILELLR